MNLPPFQDFLASLDAATISGIMKDANNAAKISANVPLIFEGDRVPCQILSISYQISLEVLAVYHKWLEQSL